MPRCHWRPFDDGGYDGRIGWYAAELLDQVEAGVDVPIEFVQAARPLCVLWDGRHRDSLVFKKLEVG